MKLRKDKVHASEKNIKWCRSPKEWRSRTNRIKWCLDLLVQNDQTCCIPNRSITDSLRDVIHFNQLNHFNLGVLSWDQKKAFDLHGHTNLLIMLKHVGFGDEFRSYIEEFYLKSFVIVNAGGGLGAQIPVLRGIRHGCPFSEQLYSLFIQSLLCRTRSDLSKIVIPVTRFGEYLGVHADEIIVYITGLNYAMALSEASEHYEKETQGKSEGFIVGQWDRT